MRNRAGTGGPVPKGGATAGTLATLDSHGMGRTLPGLGAHITEGMGHTRSPHCVANGPEVCKIIGSPQCMDNGPEVCNVISPNMLWFNNVGTLSCHNMLGLITLHNSVTCHNVPTTYG